MTSPATTLDALLAAFPGVDAPIVSEVLFARGGDAAAAAADLRELLGLPPPAVAAVAEAELAVARANVAAIAARQAGAGAAHAFGRASAGPASPALPPPTTPAPRSRPYWPPASELGLLAARAAPPTPPPPPPAALAPALAGLSLSHHTSAPTQQRSHQQHQAPPRLPALTPPPTAAEDPAMDPDALSFLCQLFDSVGADLVRDVLAMSGGRVGPAVEALIDLVGDVGALEEGGGSGGGAGAGGGGGGGGGDAGFLSGLAADLQGRSVAGGPPEATPFFGDPLAALFPRLPASSIAAARAAAGGDEDAAAARLGEEAAFLDTVERDEADAAAAARLAAELETAAAAAQAAAAAAAVEAEAAVTPANLASLAIRFPDVDEATLARALRAAGGGGVEAAAEFLAVAAGLDEVPPDPEAGFVCVAKAKAGKKHGVAGAVVTRRAVGEPAARPPRPPPANLAAAAAAPASAVAAARPPHAPGAPSPALPWASVPAAPGGFEPAAPTMPAPFKSSGAGCGSDAGSSASGGSGSRPRSAASRYVPAPPATAHLSTLQASLRADTALNAGRPRANPAIYHTARAKEAALKKDQASVVRAASDAFLRGDRVLAAALREEAARLEVKARAAHKEAIAAIVASTNTGVVSSLHLDLHFLHVEEAVRTAAIKLRHLLDDPIRVGTTILRLTPGRGNRSFAAVPRLAPALAGLLSAAGLAYKTENGGGQLAVVVPADAADAARAKAALAAAMASGFGVGEAPALQAPAPADTAAFPGLVAAAEARLANRH